MRLKLLYLGLSSFVSLSGWSMYHVFTDIPVNKVVHEQKVESAEAVKAENIEPEKPIETKQNQLTPIAKSQPAENNDISNDSESLEQIEANRKYWEEQRKQQEKTFEQEEKEREVYYAKLAEQRKAELARQAQLAEQRKLDEAAAAERKRQQCIADRQECMNDIGSQIMNLSGSAYSTAARSLGDSCNRKYRCY